MYKKFTDNIITNMNMNMNNSSEYDSDIPPGPDDDYYDE